MRTIEVLPWAIVAGATMILSACASITEEETASSNEGASITESSTAGQDKPSSNSETCEETCGQDKAAAITEEEECTESCGQDRASAIEETEDATEHQR
jgi:hypothetical protein